MDANNDQPISQGARRFTKFEEGLVEFWRRNEEPLQRLQIIHEVYEAVLEWGRLKNIPFWGDDTYPLLHRAITRAQLYSALADLADLGLVYFEFIGDKFYVYPTSIGVKSSHDR